VPLIRSASARKEDRSQAVPLRGYPWSAHGERRGSEFGGSSFALATWRAKGLLRAIPGVRPIQYLVEDVTAFKAAHTLPSGVVGLKGSRSAPEANAS
jgi:hypothetical protein